MFKSPASLADVTQHIPPKGLQLICRYGLYATRTTGRWEAMLWETVAKTGDLAALRPFREHWVAALERFETEIRRDSLFQETEK